MVSGMKKMYLYFLPICLFFSACTVHNNSPTVLIEKRCSRCHPLDTVYAVRKDAKGWRTTVEKMATYASGVIRKEEIPIITNYLAATQKADKGTETQASGNVRESR
jgi:hypothetical protein